MWVPELRGVPVSFIHQPADMDLHAQRAACCVIGTDYPSPIDATLSVHPAPLPVASSSRAVALRSDSAQTQATVTTALVGSDRPTCADCDSSDRCVKDEGDGLHYCASCWELWEAQSGPLTVSSSSGTIGATSATDTAAGLGLALVGRFEGSWKWHSGVAGPDGKVYCVPCSGSTVLVVDPVDGSATTFGNVGGTQAYKWNKGVVGSNGLIYAMPSHHPSVLVIDIAAHTVSTLGRHHGSGSKWNSAVASPIDNKVYGLPFDAPTLLVIDTARGLSTTVGDFGNGKYKWRVGLTAPDGRIFGIPYNHTSVLIIDPKARGATRMLPLPVEIARQSAKWNGGVVGADGNIYGIPCDASTVLRIDPRTEHVELLGEIGVLGSTRAKFRNGVLDPESGAIFGIPFDASGVLHINPCSGVVRLLGALGSEKGKWADGALGSDGKIYACPHNANGVLIIDPTTLSCRVEGNLSEVVGQVNSKMCGKWVECVPAAGAIVGVPVHASAALIVTPGAREHGAASRLGAMSITPNAADPSADTAAPAATLSAADTAAPAATLLAAVDDPLPEPRCATAPKGRRSQRRVGRVQHDGFEGPSSAKPRGATERRAVGDAKPAVLCASRARDSTKYAAKAGCNRGTALSSVAVLQQSISQHLQRTDLVAGWEAARRTCVGSARTPLRSAAHRARAASDRLRAGAQGSSDTIVATHYCTCVRSLFHELQAAGELDFDGLLREAVDGLLQRSQVRSDDADAGAAVGTAQILPTSPLTAEQAEAVGRISQHRYHGNYKGQAHERDLRRAIAAADEVREALARLSSPSLSTTERAKATQAYVHAADRLREEVAIGGELDMDGLLRQAVQLLKPHLPATELRGSQRDEDLPHINVVPTTSALWVARGKAAST